MKKTHLQPKKVTFEDFYEVFPVIDLPVSLGDADHHIFSGQNKPLSQSMIEEFIIPNEKEEVDEFTEFVPCFRIPDQKNFKGLVYWRAKLLDYHYILATFDNNGNVVASSHIAGMRTDGKNIARLVAGVNANLEIDMIVGKDEINSKEYEASASKSFKIIIEESGRLDISMNEEWQ